MIIIIDNNIVSALAFQAVLTDMHYFTQTAHDEYSGLRFCTGFQRDIEFVFININMPELNGYEFIQHIKNINAKIPVFAYCGNPNKILIKKCKTTGFNGFIQKPTSHERLHTFIQQFMLTKDQQGQSYNWDK